MGRPWLSQEEFEVPIEAINEALEENLSSEIDSKYFYSSNFNSAVTSKADNLKKYYYENIYYNNYGEPLLDDQNNLIGYKLNSTEYAKVNKYYNKNNIICNEVSIRDFNPVTKEFGDEALISWTDTEVLDGFIREFEGIRYF